jgi:dolichyl-phosphate beta-glucosyltransferase
MVAEILPHPRISLVVPCYNEANRLDIPRFDAFLAAEPRIRIVFVDDGSRDNTVEILNCLCSRHEDRASVLRMAVNGGKAEAVRFGINHAVKEFGPDIVGFWDADLATPLDEIEEFTLVFQQHPEIAMVFGSRVKLLGRHVVRLPQIHYLGRIFATVVSHMLRMPIYDTQCGAKMFRVSPELITVFQQSFRSRWIFDVEILARFIQLFNGDSRRLERIIYELPLRTWVDIAGSKVRPQHFVTAFADVIRIKRKYLGKKSND